MRGGAAKGRLDAEVAGRLDDHLADRRCVVEDVPEVAAQATGVEGARARQRGLLADGEQQLDVHRRALAADVAGEREQHRHGGLVVGAEDALVGVLPVAVDEHRLDGRLQWNGVQVRAQQHGAPGWRHRYRRASRRWRLPSRAGGGDAREQVAAVRARPRARVVLEHLTPSARSSAITRSAQRRSEPDGLSMRHSSAKVPFR